MKKIKKHSEIISGLKEGESITDHPYMQALIKQKVYGILGDWSKCIQAEARKVSGENEKEKT